MGIIAGTLALLLCAPGVAGDDGDLGRQLYVAKCLSCHGDGGKGDGPAARALPRKVPDLSKPSYWPRRTDAWVARFIVKGRPGAVMRPYPMTDAQVDAVVVYLRTFASE